MDAPYTGITQYCSEENLSDHTTQVKSPPQSILKTQCAYCARYMLEYAHFFPPRPPKKRARPEMWRPKHRLLPNARPAVTGAQGNLGSLWFVKVICAFCISRSSICDDHSFIHVVSFLQNPVTDHPIVHPSIACPSIACPPMRSISLSNKTQQKKSMESQVKTSRSTKESRVQSAPVQGL